MKLILGLGNIGSEYELSRHNAGFLCLDLWSHKHNMSFKHDRHFSYLRFRGACLIKPGTYMNRSGQALAEAQKRWKISEALVIHDDIELPLARLRLREGGGDGGHNGMRSLLEIMPAEDLKRVRVGIGRDSGNPRDYVLDDFSLEELQLLQPSLDLACEFIDEYIRGDFNSVLNAYSVWKKSCSGEKNPGNTRPKEINNGKEL
ncbi:MAG: aminoacyl-tRNA hydrolase [Candidatus Cloacimonetes bacterium]|jgi:PTH1 family peptidyl-tRNA hydrolase|nr:aminoacyl-tRNA hydrolase [Candidatus Cloacimonadota bacterium]